MGWKDAAAAGIFVVALAISLAVVVTITREGREERRERTAQTSGSREERVVRGLVLDYGQAVQRDDPEGACLLLSRDAYAAFDCRFGRNDVPPELAIPKGRPLDVADVVVQGDEALAQLRGGDVPQPVRLTRTGRRWKIVRVGLPRSS